jgi:hypothetical protein
LDDVAKAKRRLGLVITGTLVTKEKHELPSGDTSTVAISPVGALDASDTHLASFFGAFRVHPNGIIQQFRSYRLEQGILHFQTDGRITGRLSKK